VTADEFVDAAVELAQPLEQFASDLGDQPFDGGQMVLDAFHDVLEFESACRDVEFWGGLVQMPTEPALQASAFDDQVVAVTDEQSH
jgi:hypothetical protein